MQTISNTTNITIRIDKNLKKSVDNLFKKLGISTSSAINMFLKQCEREQGLVFTPTLAPAPSKELKSALEEIEDYKNGKINLESFDNVQAMRKALTNGK